jgi:hypothetical protein
MMLHIQHYLNTFSTDVPTKSVRLWRGSDTDRVLGYRMRQRGDEGRWEYSCERSDNGAWLTDMIRESSANRRSYLYRQSERFTMILATMIEKAAFDLNKFA